MFLVGQPVKFLGQGAQRFGQQDKLPDAHRQLVGLGLEQHAFGTDDVAGIVVLEFRVLLLAGVAVGDVELDAAAHVLDGGEARLAHHALQHHAAGNLDHDRIQVERVAVAIFVVLEQIASKVVALKLVRKRNAFGAQRLQLGASLGDDLVFVEFRRSGRLIAHDVLGVSVKCPV